MRSNEISWHAGGDLLGVSESVDEEGAAGEVTCPLQRLLHRDGHPTVVNLVQIHLRQRRNGRYARPMPYQINVTHASYTAEAYVLEDR